MAEVTLGGNPVHTSGDLPEVGGSAPSFSLVGTDLSEVTNANFAGKKLVLNIFPSVDTPTCATSVRTFNERAAGVDDTVVVCVSADLPFAHGRFCGAEGIENVSSVSRFRASFGSDLRRDPDRRAARGRPRPRGRRGRSGRNGEAHRARLRDRSGTRLRRGARRARRSPRILRHRAGDDDQPRNGSRLRVRPGCSAMCLHARITPGMKLLRS